MVRIPGDETSILATIEVVKVLLVALTVSVLVTLDNIWCMYILRKHGEVIMYQNDIGHFASTAFRTLWTSFLSPEGKAQTLERSNLFFKVQEKRRHPATGKTRRWSCYRSVRTFLLLSGVLLSLVEIIVLFTLQTEGKEVKDKPEFDVQFKDAVEVRSGSRVDDYSPYESNLSYEYVLQRLGKKMLFKNGSEFEVQVPRRLDVVQDEKWPFNVALAEDNVYASVYTRDFISEEKAQFNETLSQVTGDTESGKKLRHLPMTRKDKARNACSSSIGAVLVNGDNKSGTFCYTDELTDMSCKNRKDKDAVTFKMRCSEIRVERFGEHQFRRQIWWLSAYENKSPTNSSGARVILQMVFLRDVKRDDVSPSAIIIAALLTEYRAASVVVRREFAVDVSIVIVPNWLLITTGVLVGLVLLLGAAASTYAASSNLVDLTNWQEMFIGNLLEPVDCLNRSKRKEFRCVVSKAWDAGQKYQLFIEPQDSITPSCWVDRKEIGTLGVAKQVGEGKS